MNYLKWKAQKLFKKGSKLIEMADDSEKQKEIKKSCLQPEFKKRIKISQLIAEKKVKIVHS